VKLALLVLAAPLLGSPIPPPKPVVPWVLLTNCNVSSTNLPPRPEDRA
jgi:hypothetical protein